MTNDLAKTPLHAWHVAHGGRMVDFAGWSMPVQYGSIVSEHQATRHSAGLFDISHMGRLMFQGAQAIAFLDRLTTRRVSDMLPGQVRYSLLTNDRGGILDDVLVYRLADRGAAQQCLMVVNASNRLKVVAWLESFLRESPGVTFNDRTHELAMIAVQGPLALKLTQPLVQRDLAPVSYYHSIEAPLAGQDSIISRTGYTGEDGFELMLPAASAEKIWLALLEAGKSIGVMAAGLGCRDTLRLEAAMPLYGHELSEQTTPWEAGLAFAVDLEGRIFPGHDVLAAAKSAPSHRKRVGLQLEHKRVPREGYPILIGDEPIGEVTSGTFSPTLDRPIAMGYVRPQFSVFGTQVMIDIRGKPASASVVKLPFYRRPKL